MDQPAMIDRPAALRDMSNVEVDNVGTRPANERRTDAMSAGQARRPVLPENRPTEMA